MAHFEVAEIVAALHAVRNEWRDLQRRSREPGAREERGDATRGDARVGR